MDQAAYQQWWQLHLRVARGEALSPDQFATYESGRRVLEQQEQFPAATIARKAREELATLEAEHARLEKRRQQLDSEIASLESQLSQQTRQYLGVED